MGLFKKDFGIILACDIKASGTLKDLVRETADLDFIQGYKIGIINIFSIGLHETIEIIKKYSSLPIIYDHQKFGTDIPEVCGGKVLKKIKDAGMDGLVIFPQAGIETLRSTVNGCYSVGLVPMVGGEMTHKGYLVKEGGYIGDNAPNRIYIDAASCGVDYFIIPGTKIDQMKNYKTILEERVKSPKFLFPGIGSGQGGDIKKAFGAVKPHNSYAIIGRGIYATQHKRMSALELWKEVENLQ